MTTAKAGAAVAALANIETLAVALRPPRPTPKRPVDLDDQLMISVTEAALRCGICERTFRTLANQGKVPVVRIGRRVLVPVAELKEWIKAHTNGAGA